MCHCSVVTLHLEGTSGEFQVLVSKSWTRNIGGIIEIESTEEEKGTPESARGLCRSGRQKIGFTVDGSAHDSIKGCQCAWQA